MQTPKQAKLIKLLMDNYGQTGKTKTLGELMIEAGYSKETAKNPKIICDSEVVQEGIKDFISQLDDKRRMAITQITETKLKGSSARDNAYIADILTKNHQLLSGEETDRAGITIKTVNYGDNSA